MELQVDPSTSCTSSISKTLMLLFPVSRRTLQGVRRVLFKHQTSFYCTAASTPSGFSNLVQDPSSKYQIFVSRSNNPFLNLSIEHFLLNKTPASSTVLFFYVNRPCIVIGRNQNPWLEANLALLAGTAEHVSSKFEGSGFSPSRNGVDLIRRRSGGGAVFHDEGNTNYCVICPTEAFTRDKHVEMVVQALRKDSPRARVSARHDILLDRGHRLSKEAEPGNMHETMFGPESALKVSGSAYKITRTRALHHGTCLLDSPNLSSISQYLRSPASPYIKARGVDSVRSPVGNVYQKLQFSDPSARFEENVVAAFSSSYGLPKECLDAYLCAKEQRNLHHSLDVVCGSLDDRLAEIPDIESGMQELQSPNWIYGQTPQFLLSSHPTEEDTRQRPPLPAYFPSQAQFSMQVKHGVVESCQISFGTPSTGSAEESLVVGRLKGAKIHEVADFRLILPDVDASGNDISGISQWLNAVLAK